MTAEHRIVAKKGANRGRVVWETMSDGADNHLWDCEVLQCVGADMLNADLIPVEQQLVRQLQVQQRGAPAREQGPRPYDTNPYGQPYFAHLRD